MFDSGRCVHRIPECRYLGRHARFLNLTLGLRQFAQGGGDVTNEIHFQLDEPPEWRQLPYGDALVNQNSSSLRNL